MSDDEWALVRELLPVPGWLAGRGGRPEGYCHRQMIDAIRGVRFLPGLKAGASSEKPGEAAPSGRWGRGDQSKIGSRSEAERHAT
ncbi:transposase [Streptomyces sp. NPDC001307]|uniref:transposase n=1 Tax=Streptomyces sp. NPDC001307 TaxID=3364560 RepID=UPI0036B1223B